MAVVAQARPAAPVPAHVPSERVIQFDYLRDAALPHDPHSRLHKVQASPYDLLWTTANGGHWIATRRETIRKILQRPDLFSSAHINIPPMEYRAIRLAPEELDPPEHGKFRALLNPIFSPKMVGNLEANARQVAKQLIDSIAADGQADAVTAVTAPMPCSIFMSLMGFPVEQLPDFLRYKDQFLFADDPAEKKAGIDSIARAVEELAERRRREPAEDMMSELVRGEVDGRPLTHDELMSMGFLLFLAGLDTVTSAMTSCFAHLATHPADREALVRDPSRIREAIEEIIRRYSVVNLVRTATCDFEFEGLQIRKDEQFMVSTILANLDDQAVDDPLKVDFMRPADPHLGFGLGPHRCAGSHLARIEIRVLLEEALPRLKNLRLQPGKSLHWHSANLVGLSELPLEWDLA